MTVLFTSCHYSLPGKYADCGFLTPVSNRENAVNGYFISLGQIALLQDLQTIVPQKN